jgi:hypothetical protein
MKRIILASLFLGAVINASATSISVAVASGGITNIFMGYGKVTYMVVSASSNLTATVYDMPTNTPTLFINPAYTNIVSYATNYSYPYTNYYGVSNNITYSNAIVDVLTGVAATTNNWPARLSFNVASNASVTVDGLGYTFLYGMWITNTSPAGATGTFTVTYTK